MDNRNEIKRLYLLEYRLTFESVARFVGVAFGSVLLYLHTLNPVTLAWAALFIVTNLCVAMFYLHLLRGQPSNVEVRIAQLTYFASVASFIWMPLWMLMYPAVEMTQIGLALILCLLVQFIQRSETSRLMIAGFMIVLLIAAITLLYSFFVWTESLIVKLGIAISWAAVMFYFSRATLRMRQVILAERAAARMLAQNQKLAAVGQLAGGVAHDFNNILTVISGSFDLYHEVDDRAEKDNLIAAAAQASARAANIVRQLLIYAGKSPTHFDWVDANAPLADLRQPSLNLLPFDVAFTVRPLPRRTIVHIDTSQMALALLSLIANATDAVGENGKISLDLSLTVVSSKRPMASGAFLPVGEYVVYTVTDDGPGIPEDIRASILNPFFTTKRTGKGSGLGLSMAVSIAASVNGGLEILSSETGTVARIYVPSAQPEPGDDTPPHL